MRFLFRSLLAALLSPLAAFAQDAESWNAHFQSTYIRQVQPAFHSPYAGPRNPGYNKDRGPVAFYALRLHWEV